MGSEDLNSGPHACLSSARPTEQALQPLFSVSDFIYSWILGSQSFGGPLYGSLC